MVIVVLDWALILVNKRLVLWLVIWFDLLSDTLFRVGGFVVGRYLDVATVLWSFVALWVWLGDVVVYWFAICYVGVGVLYLSSLHLLVVLLTGLLGFLVVFDFKLLVACLIVLI